jgi:O-antigen/teichoic acid export membrane protein
MNPVESPAFRSAGWLFRKSALFLGIYGVGSLLSFGVHLLLARQLGAASYGHFVYGTHWLAVLVLPCTLGLKPTLVRFVSAYQARADWGLLRGLLQASWRWVAVASMLVMAGALGALALLHPHGDERGRSLLLLALALPVLALADVFGASTRGLGAVLRAQLPASFAQPLLVALGVLLLLPTLGASASTAAAAYLGATVVHAALSWALLQSLRPPALRAAQPQRHSAEWAAAAGANLSISVLQAARAPLVVVIAGAWIEPVQLAGLVAASRLANVAGLGLTGLSAPASPLMASLHAVDDRQGLRRLALVSAGGTLAFGVALTLPLSLFGHSLLAAFGPGFETGHASLLVLLAGELAAAAAGPVGHLMVMTGRQRDALRIEAASSVLALVLAIWLIPRHGATGAAIAMAASSVLRNGWMAAVAWRGLQAPR